MTDFDEKRTGVEESTNETNSFIKDRFENRDTVKKIKAKKRMGVFGKTILAIAVLGVVAMGLMVTWHYTRPAPTKLDITVVQEELYSIQELATAKYAYTNVEHFENARQFPIVGFDIPLTTKSFNLEYSGEIKAFFDMSKTEVKVSESKVVVTLPEISISHSIESEAKEEHSSIFNPINLKDQTDLAKDLKGIMLDRAMQLGIMDEARKNAEIAITGLISPMLDEVQTLEIKQSKTGQLADEQQVQAAKTNAEKIKKKLRVIE